MSGHRAAPCNVSAAETGHAPIQELRKKSARRGRIESALFLKQVSDCLQGAPRSTGVRSRDPLVRRHSSWIAGSRMVSPCEAFSCRYNRRKSDGVAWGRSPLACCLAPRIRHASQGGAAGNDSERGTRGEHPGRSSVTASRARGLARAGAPAAQRSSRWVSASGSGWRVRILACPTPCLPPCSWWWQVPSPG